MKPYRYELIGAKVTITKAANKSLVGLTGTVVDETKHTLVVATQNGSRRIIKRGVTMRVQVKGQEVEIDGDMIDMSPEERVKLK